MSFLGINQIERIETCQQEMYKLIMDDNRVYFYKNYKNNQSWWTFLDENICKREWDVYQKFHSWGIPVAPFKAVSDHYFVTEEVRGVPLTEGVSYYDVGKVLKKIHSHGYIHGDFHHRNIFVDPYEGRVKAVIDFEESVPIEGTYPHLPDHLKPDPMYDLAIFLRSCKHFDRMEHYDSFLEGYGLPEHMSLGIEIWEEREKARNALFRRFCAVNDIESIIC